VYDPSRVEGSNVSEGSNWREIPFSPDVLDTWDVHSSPDDEEDPERARLRTELVAMLRELVSSRLTDRQRRIVELYFYDRKTQTEIAAELGISQQVVSRQLFGVVRNGKKVGGAIKRLQDVCAELGIEWV
jgi:RNA polymerase sigma factor (sigma-70 family)